MTRVLGVLLLATACTHAQQAPAPAPPNEPPPVAVAAPAPAPAVATVAADPPAAPQGMAPLSPSPTHDALTWFVDVIGHRDGEVSRDELAQHCDKGFLGPASGTSEQFHGLARTAAGAVLESIEVDDPTYIRAYMATSANRWQVILQVEGGKITYLSYHIVR